MKTTTLSLLLAACFVAGGAATGEGAESSRYSKSLQQACVNDYKQHCGEYGIDTEALRLCMDRNGGGLSKTCVDALVAAGEVSRSEVEHRKKQGH